jgi:hypothetical protein
MRVVASIGRELVQSAPGSNKWALVICEVATIPGMGCPREMWGYPSSQVGWMKISLDSRGDLGEGLGGEMLKEG